MERIELHTNWTNTVQEVHTLALPELADARLRQKLKWAFSESDVNELKPGKTREALTKEVAEEFVRLAQNLRDRGHDPEKVAHFVNRMVFCMFAEDVDLLPDRLFKRMLEASLDEPESFAENAQKLFAAMARKDGRLDFRRIEWFNGGIFDDDAALPLTKADIKVALAAAGRNWSNIDPSIMGTLFERGLDPGKRSQLGAHYTDPDKIMLIVNPVIVEPLTREWESAKPEIADLLTRSKKHHHAATKTALYNQARNAYQRCIERLASFRVLDPACGSGNFLYMALKCLKDIELQVNHEAEAMGLTTALPQTGPENVKGIEINPFAAELARVSVWIGEIQWMREHGFVASRNPILKPLETIECRDALLNEDGTEAKWPDADVIIGNPPFLGSKRMLNVLKEPYVKVLRSVFNGRVTASADLVVHWFQKAYEQVIANKTRSVGLVATQAIRRGGSRRVLQRIVDHGRIFDAWDDEEWTVEGADVRVSLICFDANGKGPVRLDGTPVARIAPALVVSNETDAPESLQQNQGV
jgi:type II restriction/modification system DNA methylase subunit YeeA